MRARLPVSTVGGVCGLQKARKHFHSLCARAMPVGVTVGERGTNAFHSWCACACLPVCATVGGVCGLQKTKQFHSLCARALPVGVTVGDVCSLQKARKHFHKLCARALACLCDTW